MCIRDSGYTAVQVGFGDIREKLVNKPETGHFAKAGVAVKRFVKEFRFENAAEYEVGQEIKADIFCLLYTSDAADDLLCVDLGGRRVIKKKKKE